jgi:histidine triad (HIT) family protein
MTPADCVFCRIIDRIEPATIVFEDDTAISFLPLPADRLADGHVLVLPKRHLRDLFEATQADLDATIHAVRRVADSLREALGATGVNILNASGQHSDQSVFHFHFHVVPRWRGDGLRTWPAGTSTHGARGDVAGMIRHHFSQRTTPNDGPTRA